MADDHGNARHHKHARRLDLGNHAARAHRGARTARCAHYGAVDALHALNQTRIGVGVGVCVIQAVNIGEDNHQIGVNQTGNQRRQRIVVSEANLLNGNGIVLVDNGDHAQLKQATQRVTRMQVSRTIRRIASRKQYHRSQQVMLGKRVGVRRGKRALPH